MDLSFFIQHSLLPKMDMNKHITLYDYDKRTEKMTVALLSYQLYYKIARGFM